MASEHEVTLEEVLKLAMQLKWSEQVQLVETMANQTQYQLLRERGKPRKSLRGLWRGVDITESDIAQMRQEMWGNFPRDSK